MRVLNAELEPLILSKAAQFGLPPAWVSRLAKTDPERRQVGGVLRSHVLFPSQALHCPALSVRADSVAAQHLTGLASHAAASASAVTLDLVSSDLRDHASSILRSHRHLRKSWGLLCHL